MAEKESHACQKMYCRFVVVTGCSARWSLLLFKTVETRGGITQTTGSSCWQTESIVGDLACNGHKDKDFCYG